MLVTIAHCKIITTPNAAFCIKMLAERRRPSQVKMLAVTQPPQTTQVKATKPVSNTVEYMDDLRILSYDTLIQPHVLSLELPLSGASKRTIAQARDDCRRVILGQDDRVIVIVGPCSIHDVSAALEYAGRLKQLTEEVSDALVVIMRCYFEKPRTTVGWKGLINDPYLNGSFQINAGLRIGRKLLCDLTNAGVPVGCELLDTVSPQFLGDLISWGAIGARTTESQLHRELASGVSFPVGFKNGTDGSVQIAVDAIRAASHAHHFLGVNHHGSAAITRTSGNDTCHVILRGGNGGTNYDSASIGNVNEHLVKNKLREAMMVDCSHGNSQKQHSNQLIVTTDLCKQISAGEQSIMGVMIESNLVEGNQKLPANGQSLDTLVYGQSVTDACVNWDDTELMLRSLRKAVLTRRATKSNE